MAILTRYPKFNLCFICTKKYRLNHFFSGLFNTVKAPTGHNFAHNPH